MIWFDFISIKIFYMDHVIVKIVRTIFNVNFYYTICFILVFLFFLHVTFCSWGDYTVEFNSSLSHTNSSFWFFYINNFEYLNILQFYMPYHLILHALSPKSSNHLIFSTCTSICHDCILGSNWIHFHSIHIYTHIIHADTWYYIKHFYIHFFNFLEYILEHMDHQ